MPELDDRAPRSLTVEEARSRARLITVRETVIDLDLTGAGDTFTSTTTITFDCAAGEDLGTFLDLKASELRRVTLNGADLDRSTWVAGRLPLTGRPGANTVRVEAGMAYASDGEGLHRHVDPADGNTYLYAMSFLDAAPKWFACFDQPDLKSDYRLTVRAPEDWTVLGNGPSRQTAPGTWEISPTAPLSTYVVTLVAGPYASVVDEHEGIPLGFHVRASWGEFLREQASDLLEVTRACLDYYHRTFGIRYPFGEYHQAFVPDFNAGAMENPGCVTLRDSFVFRARATDAERASRAGVIAHEMAHMWFGDLVTMRWWDDLWLNESFAEYLAHRCCTAVTRYPLWTEFGVVRKDWGAVADQSPSTHPVAGNGSADAAAALQDFDGISYAKGAAVLGQLAAHLGDEVFFGGLTDYFATHRFGNAAFADLMAAWTRAGARDLDAWATAWLRTSGMDLLTSTGSTLRRVAPDDTRRPHAVTVSYHGRDGQQLGRQPVTLTGDQVKLTSPDGAVVAIPDADDVTWARIRFGDAPWDSVAEAVRRTETPGTRVVFWNAVRDAVRSAHLDPEQALRLVADLVPSQPDDVVVTSVLRFAREELAGPYAPPPQRAGRTARLRAVADRLLAGAAPGSDRQLVAFRAAIRSGADVAELQGWLDGRGLPPGVAMDPELSWSVVGRLAALAGDPEPVDRQLRVDGSAAGRVHAARARAGLADSEAKARAWALLTEPSETGAYELYATAEGFFMPSQNALTSPYAARYFSEIPATTGFRTGWLLGRLALLAYPTPHSTEETLLLAERALERPDLAAPIRRSVVDGTDALRRAVASRQRFA